MIVSNPTITFSQMLKEDEPIASPGADVTVLAAETDIVSVNLGALRVGDILLINVSFQIVKGGVAGACAFYLRTVLITDPWTMEYFPSWRFPALPAGETWRHTGCIAVKILTAPDILGGLKLTADSPGSNSTCTAASTTLKVWQLRQ